MSPSKVAPPLHHERVTAPGADPGSHLVFLHGIFGAGRNWTTVARRLVRERPEWGALLVDVRQHGSSQGFPPPHTLAAAAADVGRLIVASEHAVRGVLGHSFGGKVALELVRGVGAAAVLETLWVVDSTPEARAPGGSAWAVLAALRKAPGPFRDRAAGGVALLAQSVPESVARWMATNLEERMGGWRWRIDATDMEAMLLDFFQVDLWSVVEGPPEELEVHMVKTEESSVLGPAACRRVEEAERRTGRVYLHRIAGGHWVNADNPDALLSLLREKLP